MGWFEGGEGSFSSGGGDDMPGGHKLILLLLLGAFIFIMIVSIGAFGFYGLIGGLAFSLLALGFLGIFFGDY